MRDRPRDVVLTGVNPTLVPRTAPKRAKRRRNARRSCQFLLLGFGERSGSGVWPAVPPETMSRMRPHDRSLLRLLERLDTAGLSGLMPTLLDELSDAVGAVGVRLLIADVEARRFEMREGLSAGQVPHSQEIEIEGSVHGRAYTDGVLERTAIGGSPVVITPVTARHERQGVLEVTLAEHPTDEDADVVETTGVLLGYLVTAGDLWTDEFHFARRRREMSLAAEIQWNLLPLAAFESREVSVAGALEPAYEVGGDAFDYACGYDDLTLGIFDSMGHGLRASRLSALCVSTFRNARRAGRPLEEQAARIHETLRPGFETEGYTTGAILRVDLRSPERLRRRERGPRAPVPAARRRRRRAARPLEAEVPFGMPFDTERRVQRLPLQAGDRLTLFSDGIIEAQPDGGAMYGLEALAQLLDGARNLPPREVARTHHADGARPPRRRPPGRRHGRDRRPARSDRPVDSAPCRRSAQAGAEMPPQYDPTEVEPRWTRTWIERGYFHARVPSDKPPFCIVIPPPNVTGRLHMGHALGRTLEDTLIRRARMQGFEALWLPGTDHAGIATQVVVERELRGGGHRPPRARPRGVRRARLGVEGAVRRRDRRADASAWAPPATGSAQRFTMDEGLSRAVRVAFVRLYEDGLIYRGERLVNWCPTDRTGLSDSEVEHEDVDGRARHVPLPARRRQRRHRGRHHARRDDARRHRDRRASRRRALRGAGRADRHASVRRRRDPDRRRPPRGPGVRHRRGEGHARARPERLRDRAAAPACPLMNILNADATLNDAVPPEFRGLDRYAARAAVRDAARGELACWSRRSARTCTRSGTATAATPRSSRGSPACSGS